jgi:hypothetical protein
MLTLLANLKVVMPVEEIICAPGVPPVTEACATAMLLVRVIDVVVKAVQMYVPVF